MLEAVYNEIDTLKCNGVITYENNYIKWTYDGNYDMFNVDANEHLENIKNEDFEIIDEILSNYRDIEVSEPEIDEMIVSVYISQ